MQFTAGRNIAIKVPDHEYHATVQFYREILGFEDAVEYDSEARSVAVSFGDKVLWIDSVATISQAEIWLEIKTDNVTEARATLASKGVAFRESIEPLPEDVNGFWISGPSNIIHLIHGD